MGFLKKVCRAVKRVFHGGGGHHHDNGAAQRQLDEMNARLERERQEYVAKIAALRAQGAQQLAQEEARLREEFKQKTEEEIARALNKRKEDLQKIEQEANEEIELLQNHISEMAARIVQSISSSNGKVDFDRIICGYSDRELLGSGGFGAVYKAKLDDAAVAVKKIHPGPMGKIDLEQLNQVKNEIKSWSKLRHPNIAQFIGFSISESNGGVEQLCLISELIKGSDLHSFIHVELESLSLLDGLNMAKQIAEAMNYMHTKENMAHRDLKTRNVMVYGGNKIKLIDFGLSKAFNPIEASSTMQTSKRQPIATSAIKGKDGSIVSTVGMVGTLQFMAPEILSERNITAEFKRNDAENWKKADVYSFAMILYELVFMRPVWLHKSNDEIKDAVLNGRRPEIVLSKAGVPVEVIALIEDCWEADPNARPSFAEIIRVMESLILPIVRGANVDRNISDSVLRTRQSRREAAQSLRKSAAPASKPDFQAMQRQLSAQHTSSTNSGHRANSNSAQKPAAPSAESEFMTACGTDAATAKFYLESCQGNFDAAINLYLSHQ